MDPSAPAGILDQLRDIHLPPEPGFWPPAPGWWLLAAVALGVMAWLGWRGIRALRRYLLYRRVNAELGAICARHRQHGSDQRLTAEVSRLLRRAALRGHPREEVAGLSGTAWLRFLDGAGAAEPFSRGPGRCLASVPYGAADVEVDAEALASLARGWLRNNLGR